MSSTEDIRKAIKGLSEKTGMVNILCKVESVDLVNKSCYCQPVFGGADIQDVRLIADNQNGFLIIPAINSVVIVSMLNQAVGYVSMFSNVQEIQLNGDNFGGLIKIDNLKSQYDTNFTNLKAAIQAALAPVDAIMVALGMPAPLASQIFNTAAQSVVNLNKTPLENTTVKHGNGN